MLVERLGELRVAGQIGESDREHHRGADVGAGQPAPQRGAEEETMRVVDDLGDPLPFGPFDELHRHGLLVGARRPERVERVGDDVGLEGRQPRQCRTHDSHLMLEIVERRRAVELLGDVVQRSRVALRERFDPVGSVGKTERPPDPRRDLERGARGLRYSGRVEARALRHQHAIEREEREPAAGRGALDLVVGRAGSHQEGAQITSHQPESLHGRMRMRFTVVPRTHCGRCACSGSPHQA